MCENDADVKELVNPKNRYLDGVLNIAKQRVMQW